MPSALLYAMEASVNLILSIGPEAIEQRVLGLADDLRSRLTKLGAVLDQHDSPNGPMLRSQIVAARFPNHDATQLAAELRRKRVLVAARHGRMRVSPHFYNNERDIDRFESELKTLL